MKNSVNRLRSSALYAGRRTDDTAEREVIVTPTERRLMKPARLVETSHSKRSQTAGGATSVRQSSHPSCKAPWFNPIVTKDILSGVPP